MLTLPPPVWALVYMLTAGGISRLIGAGLVPGLPVVPVAAAVIMIGVALAVSAALLFWREGTEINPTSASNRVLVTAGPYRFTRNPMYLSLVCITLASRCGSAGGRCC